VLTQNGYEATSSSYNFVATKSYYADLEGVELRVEDDSAYCQDNGCIRLYCTTEEEFSGNFVVTRASEATGYLIWEDLAYLVYSKKVFEDDLIYTDFTVESGIKYKYAIQQENSAGLRTSPMYPLEDVPYSVDFSYSYLYRDGVQLRISLSQ
jgi:hypothetical protein